MLYLNFNSFICANHIYMALLPPPILGVLQDYAVAPPQKTKNKTVFEFKEGLKLQHLWLII